jgi:hypothetical protein
MGSELEGEKWRRRICPHDRCGTPGRANEKEEQKKMNWDLDVELPAAQIVHCYVGSGTPLHAGMPLLELRIGSNPLQTLTYGENHRVVVRRMLPQAALPTGALPASIPLAIVESMHDGAGDAPEAMLIVSIFEQEGYYRAALSLATWRAEERELVLEVFPGQLESSRLPSRYRTLLTRPRSHLAAGLGWNREARL